MRRRKPKFIINRALIFDRLLAIRDASRTADGTIVCQGLNDTTLPRIKKCVEIINAESKKILEHITKSETKEV